MIRVARRRPSSARGFALTEALVALAIAALTITVLTSSSWGLATVADRRAAAAQTGPVDWLAARRALMQWSSGVTATRRETAPTALTGTASTARFFVEPSGGGQSRSFVGELEIVARGEGRFSLQATRYLGQSDARLGADTGQTTEILRSNQPIRILYYFENGRGSRSGAWRYETGDGDDGLPKAIGIEVGDTRRLTAPLFVNRSAACVARLGRGGLEEEACELK